MTKRQKRLDKYFKNMVGVSLMIATAIFCICLMGLFNLLDLFFPGVLQKPRPASEIFILLPALIGMIIFGVITYIIPLAFINYKLMYFLLKYHLRKTYTLEEIMEGVKRYRHGQEINAPPDIVAVTKLPWFEKLGEWDKEKLRHLIYKAYDLPVPD